MGVAVGAGASCIVPVRLASQWVWWELGHRARGGWARWSLKRHPSDIGVSLHVVSVAWQVDAVGVVGVMPSLCERGCSARGRRGQRIMREPESVSIFAKRVALKGNENGMSRGGGTTGSWEQSRVDGFGEESRGSTRFQDCGNTGLGCRPRERVGEIRVLQNAARRARIAPRRPAGRSEGRSGHEGDKLGGGGSGRKKTNGVESRERSTTQAFRVGLLLRTATFTSENECPSHKRPSKRSPTTIQHRPHPARPRRWQLRCRVRP